MADDFIPARRKTIYREIVSSRLTHLAETRGANKKNYRTIEMAKMVDWYDDN